MMVLHAFRYEERNKKKRLICVWIKHSSFFKRGFRLIAMWLQILPAIGLKANGLLIHTVLSHPILSLRSINRALSMR